MVTCTHQMSKAVHLTLYDGLASPDNNFWYQSLHPCESICILVSE